MMSAMHLEADEKPNARSRAFIANSNGTAGAIDTFIGLIDCKDSIVTVNDNERLLVAIDH